MSPLRVWSGNNSSCFLKFEFDKLSNASTLANKVTLVNFQIRTLTTPITIVGTLLLLSELELIGLKDL